MGPHLGAPLLTFEFCITFFATLLQKALVRGALGRPLQIARTGRYTQKHLSQEPPPHTQGTFRRSPPTTRIQFRSSAVFPNCAAKSGTKGTPLLCALVQRAGILSCQCTTPGFCGRIGQSTGRLVCGVLLLHFAACLAGVFEAPPARIFHPVVFFGFA